MKKKTNKKIKKPSVKKNANNKVKSKSKKRDTKIGRAILLLIIPIIIGVIVLINIQEFPNQEPPVLLGPPGTELPISLSDQGTGVRDKVTGNLLSTGNLTVDIYEAESGGTPIYTETFTDAITDGAWNVMLGEDSANPLPLQYGQRYYKDYTITVGLNVENADFGNASALGGTVDRQFFFSPIGGIADEDISKTTDITTSGTGSFGDLGIGTTTPDTTLHVFGNATITENLTVFGNATFLDSLGVGTGAPETQLDVVGMVRASGPNAYTVPGSGIGVEIITLAGGAGGIFSVDRDAEPDAYRNLRLGTNNLLIGGGALFGAGNVFVDGNLTANRNLYVNGNLTVVKNATFLDRVGVGTNTPTKELEVIGDVSFTGGDIIGSGGTYIDIGEENAGGFTLSSTNGGTFPDIYCKGSAGINTLCEFRSGAIFSLGNVFISNELKTRGGITNDISDLVLNDNVHITNGDLDVNPPEYSLFVDASTNSVGIGTGSPGSSFLGAIGVLEVNSSGETFITINSPFDHNTGIMFLHNNSFQWAISSRANTTSVPGTQGRLAFSFNTSGCPSNICERVSFTPEGRVGIGTTSPSALLHVNGTGDLVRITNGSIPLFYINGENGYVAIGMDTPTVDFELHKTKVGKDVTFRVFNADATNSNSNGVIRLGGGTNGRGKILFIDSQNFRAGIVSSTADDLRFQTSSNLIDRMTITSSGKVGIGTTNPSNDLDIHGGLGYGTLELDGTDFFGDNGGGCIMMRDKVGNTWTKITTQGGAIISVTDSDGLC